MPVAPFELVDRPTFEDNWTFCDVEFRRLGQTVPRTALVVLSPDGKAVLAFKRVKQPVVRKITRYAYKDRGYETSSSPHNSTAVRLTFVEVDGVLKEVLVGREE